MVVRSAYSFFFSFQMISFSKSISDVEPFTICSRVQAKKTLSLAPESPADLWLLLGEPRIFFINTSTYFYDFFPTKFLCLFDFLTCSISTACCDPFILLLSEKDSLACLSFILTVPSAEQFFFKTGDGVGLGRERKTDSEPNWRCQAVVEGQA